MPVGLLNQQRVILGVQIAVLGVQIAVPVVVGGLVLVVLVVLEVVVLFLGLGCLGGASRAPFRVSPVLLAVRIGRPVGVVVAQVCAARRGQQSQEGRRVGRAGAEQRWVFKAAELGTFGIF